MCIDFLLRFFLAWDFYKVEQTLGGFSIFSQYMKPRASPHASINTNSPKPSLFIIIGRGRCAQLKKKCSRSNSLRIIVSCLTTH